MEKARQGTEIVIRVTTRDRLTDPPPLYNPESVTVLLTDPEGNVILNDTTMSNISTGRWQTRYQLADDAPVGEWIGRFKSTDGGSEVVTRDYSLFEVVAD